MSAIQLVMIFWIPTIDQSSIAASEVELPEVADWRIKSKRCPIHGEELRKDVQPVMDASFSYDPIYYSLREELFPCAYDRLARLGTKTDRARVKYCPKCRFAKVMATRGMPPPPHPVEFAGHPDGYRRAWRRAFDAYVARQHLKLEMNYRKSQ